jgi:glucan phosphoethanolaminetransferase (alkaline phosphatase superfamily)
LGPTPRYSVIPRWGLVDQFDAVGEQKGAARSGPSPVTVRTTLLATMAVLGAAALIHLVRYVLLIINRSVLLNPWVAGAATWLGIAASVIAVFMVIASFVVLSNWLIARRSAAFAYRGHEDSRPVWVLRWGSLVPLVNLLWAPTFVIELAGVEERLSWLRRPIAGWWLLWVASTAVSIYAFATSFTTDAQGIADNTVTTILAYLLALAALLLAYRVVLGFERQPVERRSKRWVVVADDQAGHKADERGAARHDTTVESQGQNPAA